MNRRQLRAESSAQHGAKLYFGKVMHRRLRPVSNAFAYPVFFLSVPLTHTESLANRWFSVNRWNLFSLRFADYGTRDGSDPLAWAHELLESSGLGCADGEIWLRPFHASWDTRSIR